MKNFYKNNAEYIWYFLCTLSITLGVFVDVTYGFFILLIIGINFYIELDTHISHNFTETDRFGVSFVALLFHVVVYVIIIVGVSIFVDKEQIKVSNSYEVKYIENEKVLISKDDKLVILDNPKLYWECRAKNCKNILITNITVKPVNNIYSKDLPYKSYEIYSTD